MELRDSLGRDLRMRQVETLEVLEAPHVHQPGIRDGSVVKGDVPGGVDSGENDQVGIGDFRSAQLHQRSAARIVNNSPQSLQLGDGFNLLLDFEHRRFPLLFDLLHDGGPCRNQAGECDDNEERPQTELKGGRNSRSRSILKW